MTRAISFFERALTFIISFAIVVYLMVRFRLWSSDFVWTFYMTDHWLELLFVLLVSIALSMFLTWLIRLEFRVLADVRERRKK